MRGRKQIRWKPSFNCIAGRYEQIDAIIARYNMEELNFFEAKKLIEDFVNSEIQNGNDKIVEQLARDYY